MPHESISRLFLYTQNLDKYMWEWVLEVQAKNIILDGGKFIDMVGLTCHSIFKYTKTLLLT